MKGIGFMQGRLSPDFEGKIQFFPRDHWKEEFEKASQNKFNIMEWTLDYDGLYDNPLMIFEGQSEIKQLMSFHSVEIPSLTADCFMQMPFYKFYGSKQDDLVADYLKVVKACGKMSIKDIVFPLVDNGRLESYQQEELLIERLLCNLSLLEENDVNILFESDYPPRKLRDFITKFPNKRFGINYDIGNSAALGYDPYLEFSLYGERIGNVHVKDRKYKGTTVPLGQGSAKFELVFRELKKLKYNGYLILQAARAQDDNHLKALIDYRNFITDIIEKI